MATLETLETRIEIIEEVLMQMQEAMQNVVSTEALRQLMILKQRELADLETEVEALRSEITLLKGEVFK